MSVFASSAKHKSSKFPQNIDQRLVKVKSALEHLSLYVGLAVYTAIGQE